MLTHPKDSHQLKRTQALLWVDEGESISRVAQRLRVTRQSIYNWIEYINQRKGPIFKRLEDANRSGRPRTKSDIVDEVVPQLLGTNPAEVGYRATGWTNRVLCHYIYRHYHIQVSHQTIREAIKRAGYRWKRPRYVLSNRPKRWRQAKGGSKKD